MWVLFEDGTTEQHYFLVTRAWTQSCALLGTLVPSDTVSLLDGVENAYGVLVGDQEILAATAPVNLCASFYVKHLSRPLYGPVLLVRIDPPSCDALDYGT